MPKPRTHASVESLRVQYLTLRVQSCFWAKELDVPRSLDTKFQYSFDQCSAGPPINECVNHIRIRSRANALEAFAVRQRLPVESLSGIAPRTGTAVEAKGAAAIAKGIGDTKHRILTEYRQIRGKPVRTRLAPQRLEWCFDERQGRPATPDVYD
ncbi:hypothetical protein AJ78_02883 [Emergomyces pasteurianus Ep9510]|uniref:Uncharacterized protein n=1 Tax=Emergomyces pasteurianus Ep9510 TaxID=1447872 RepID=A0A1J9PM88_9EURO|nr:hypothetical protein AJ78_02883 [Emergomyces pasteurianus Ep9510]